MTKLKSRSAAVAVIVCFAAEVIFSDALKVIFELSGKSAPVCILLGGAAAVALMPIASRFGNKIAALSVAAIYTYIILFRLANNTAYLYNKEITAYILIGAVILIIISAVKGIRGAGIYSALCFIPLIVVFIVCCAFGGVDFNRQFIGGIFSGNILSGSVAALVLFFPFSLCAVFIGRDNLKSAVISGSAAIISIFAMAIIAIGVFGKTASDYPSVIAEMSKNVSVGKFFQRLEGFADASYIVAVSSVISILGAMIGECIRMINFKRSKALAALTLAVISVTLCGCTAKHEIETQTFVVITAFEGDKIHLITESGNGSNMYTADTADLSEAVRAVEQSKNVSISLLQAEMVIIGKNANIERAMNQALNSDMPNSASIMLTDGDLNKLYEVISNNYPSAFDYAAAVQSNAERSGFACEPASALKAGYEELGKMTVVVLDENGIKGSITVINSKD